MTKKKAVAVKKKAKKKAAPVVKKGAIKKVSVKKVPVKKEPAEKSLAKPASKKLPVEPEITPVKKLRLPKISIPNEESPENPDLDSMEAPPLGDAPVSVMQREERNEKIKELIALASEHGFLTHEDIEEALPEDLVVPEDAEKVVALLRSMEVEIIRADDVEEFKARMEKEEREKQSARSDVLDDPVRMYLKQMG